MNKIEETYEVSRDEAHTLNIGELVRHSSSLAMKLRRAKEEISEQRMDIERLQDNKLALRLELADANNEIARLVTALTHEPEHAAGAPRAGRN